ncbi:hypothetical protein pqer_cds_5 [Pandoravirus quercus]|uniref:Uncharacterized protein n=1 Tax=Pandoravirus quercus TaxID=2107709 RepID=A0A2U7U7M7_9VIRU|nr:hypothetical protein pqer_cds_2 [Pandoravirus quercus]YP_009482696.1 hypothetical protein pqer_cds_5 [Pandoravirus quercus]AVK74424.1 hypothetical protein pqer_cds_2 [Pandoravirus quercus]AVK74427.1 hypothetical protein pqer_cds_5 [Pandoravirus quercus]
MDSPVTSTTPTKTTVAFCRASAGDVPWAEVQRREIRALRAARGGARKGARGPPAVYVVLHRLYRYFTAISRHAAPADAPAEAEGSARHSTVPSDGDDDGDVPVYACFDDVCANEVGVHRYAAHRAIKETLLASLFQQVIAPAATRDGLRDCVASGGCHENGDDCDDGQQQQRQRRCAHRDDGDDAALAAETAPSAYRCLLGLVSEWSAPADWIEWRLGELQTWIEEPQRAALLNTLVSVWRGAKARAIADRDADMEKGRRRGQGRGRRSAMLQIIRGHIEAAFKDAAGGGSPAAGASSSPRKRNFSASLTTTVMTTGHERAAGPEGGATRGADQRALKRPRLSHEKDDARSREIGQSEPSLACDAVPSAGAMSLDDAPNGCDANLVAPKAITQTTCAAAVEQPQRPALAARSGATDDKVEAAVRGLLTAAVSGNNNNDGGGSDDDNDDTSVDALISAIDAVRPILLRRQQRQQQRRQTRLGEPGGSPLAG